MHWISQNNYEVKLLSVYMICVIYNFISPLECRYVLEIASTYLHRPVSTATDSGFHQIILYNIEVNFESFQGKYYPRCTSFPSIVFQAYKQFQVCVLRGTFLVLLYHYHKTLKGWGLVIFLSPQFLSYFNAFGHTSRLHSCYKVDCVFIKLSEMYEQFEQL